MSSKEIEQLIEMVLISACLSVSHPILTIGYCFVTTGRDSGAGTGCYEAVSRRNGRCGEDLWRGDRSDFGR